MKEIDSRYQTLHEIFIVVEQHDYEGYELPEEFFLTYKDALAHLRKLARQRRLKVRMHDYVQFNGGTIEIHKIKVKI